MLHMTMDELRNLPVSVDLVTAGRAFGLGRTKAFELAQVGEFPCAVLRVGNRYRVPRFKLLEALGIDPNQLPEAASRPVTRTAPRNRQRRVEPPGAQASDAGAPPPAA